MDYYTKFVYTINVVVRESKTTESLNTTKRCMQKINIYLENQDKKRLDELKYKYHLSYSTIAETIGHYLVLLFTIDELQNNYLHEKKGTKTSIQPKTVWEVKKPSIFYTNIVLMYVRKEIKQNLEKLGRYKEKEYTKIMNKIVEEMRDKYDERWNGNQLSRFIPKFVKENKSYIKRLIEE